MNLKNNVNNSIEKAIHFLINNQEPSGAWIDFDLDIGVSDSWVTAFVGMSLREVAIILSNQHDNDYISKSLSFLSKSMNDDGGWGYNNNCLSDCDSTAHVILFLSKCDAKVPPNIIARLLSFQQPDGGFKTFSENLNDGWNFSHPDISVIAVKALSTVLPYYHPSLVLGRSYLKSWGQNMGLIPAYWWSSQYFSTMHFLELSKYICREDTYQLDPESFIDEASLESCFELALFLSILVHYPEKRDAFDRVLIKILDKQDKNEGFFPGSQILRVTQRRFLKPWEEKSFSGYVYTDINHLYTTALVTYVLAKAYKYAFVDCMTN